MTPMRTVAAAILVLSLSEPASAQASDFIDKTRITFDPAHGVQVSYTRPDGAMFLWYPGNRVVLPGRWDVRSGQICFRSGPNTEKPVAGESGGRWNCRTAEARARHVVDRVDGDVFGLATRKEVPFLLTPQRTIVAELMKRI